MKSYDAKSRKVTTDRGQVTVGLKGVDGVSGYSLMHADGHGCFAAIALESISWQGKPVVSGPSGAYVYAMCETDDLTTTAKLLLKSEQPGTLKISSRNSPKSVRLVDITPVAKRDLAPLPWSSKDGTIEITTKPTEQAYWVVAEW
jgi:hypothetical protein